ncbi:HlyC/CorC family transporter [Arthrobacter sp. TES]|uniref:hemolysin family protein n=1 Tax=Paenarthrobacter ureafaciens TaxID=37931 RepID=UPI000397B158|nr:hemolysin family protein [Paenarthrobacter ureafaciens]AOY72668.1 membrane protein [Arthrobacter sp. ZXY-2]QOI64301.1 HlyC/CorC family transporter [Arthrobacter sp. TES]GLU58883.1 membrane protein [Paenarthrobacter ureafaciens]GLU63150.1 membrane protein [Paenarthrobacter ureafaciens]GLU67424.1 membrane protein [Paenarthrobacter ureafaciens]
MYEWIMLGIGLVLTVGTGFFVASEFALVNLDRTELEARQARGEKRLGPTIRALKITSTHLSGAQLGITLTTLLTGYTFEPAISRMLSEPLQSWGLPADVVPGVGAVAGIFLATVFSMVIGELVPKNFALALPLATAKVVVPFQALFTAVFKPAILLFNNTANKIIRSFGIEPKEELSGARSAEELSSLVRRSAMEGLLDQDHAELLNRTLRFSEHTAGDVMTPRVRMTTVDADQTAAEIVELASATGFSRFPVIGRDRDEILGVLHVKQAFAVPLEQRDAVVATSLMTEPLYVPESKDVDALLVLLRKQGLQVAIVSDEHGGTAGIVTLEDLVEEIVGELEDEHDRARAGVVRVGRSITFDASLRPDELLDRTGIVVPEGEEYDTVAGFMSDQLDRVPELGDEVAVGGGVLRVERVAGAQLGRIRFTPDPDTEQISTHDQIINKISEELRP